MTLVKLMSEPEYREVQAISYSMLSGVSKTPASLINTEKFESPALTYGSAVDTMVFDGEEEFKKKFCVNSGISPSPIVEKITRQVMKAVIETKGSLAGSLDDYDDLILTTAKALEYGKGWKDDTIIRKIKDEGGKDLYSFTIENEGKKILDTIQYENVLNSANTLYTHDFTKEWFTAGDGEEVHFQFPVLWAHKGKACKSLFDIIKIDHNKKIIYPVDLKTTGDHVLSFPYNFLKWNYYLQASFYYDAIVYLKLQNPELFTYTIDYMRFVVIGSNDPMRPLVYQSTYSDYWAGRYGAKIKKTGDTIKGYEELMNDMEWHLTENKFEYPREVYNNSGVLKLDLFEN
jgi:hypothetical protein